MMAVLALENAAMMIILASAKLDILEMTVMNVTMDTLCQILQMEKRHVQVCFDIVTRVDQVWKKIIKIQKFIPL